MFSTLGLFSSVACPERASCTRPNCLFSHSQNLPLPRPLGLPQVRPSQPVASSSSASPPARAAANKPKDSLIPTKRPAVSPVTGAFTSPEPPRKFQKVGSAQRPSALPTASYTESGAPILRVNAAQSLVAVPVRQTMLKTLYDHFIVLYHKIIPANPSIAADHALKQEEEMYKKSTKLTYRNAVIQCVAALKRRAVPTSVNDPTVGTEDEIIAKAEAQKKLASLHLSRESLEHLVHSVEDLQKWGYFVEIPETPGGHMPSMEGKIVKCDRCVQYYVVKPVDNPKECVHHWGKPYTTRAGGEKVRTYTCCLRPVADGGGCSHGPHVFYESKVEDLHARHPFSSLQPTEPNNTCLDVAAVDCEMIYTTGGMRVARVSVVDGSGKEVLDEIIRMDEGVLVVDYNTRFSGITEENHATATLDLAGVRQALKSFVNSDTILIGHALDNDLKTLRIIHHRCIDTALLFPHKAGPPYRRALRELVREKLNKVIQTGGATQGHSSLEDASATLDLVRWFIMNKSKSGIQVDS
ncbi:unnamed protein product [Cyclocybe aegerita]|uniref:Exonuclease domain-containing protein n=1 Tax=Cyclocybe aegerita TaxID=1973307 RepID=A0A8S0WDT0_CYCAE|nr:unnamed protein product [Cyclocybe aegerita]